MALEAILPFYTPASVSKVAAHMVVADKSFSAISPRR
jgi:hypothetical protein